MIRRFTVAATLALLALLGLSSSSPYAADPPPQASGHVPDEVIVRFRQGADESTKELARFRVFGMRKKVFKHVDGLEVIKLPANVKVEEAIDAYEQDPNVLYAEPNYILHTTANPNIALTPNDPRFKDGSLWGLTKINAPGAWNTTTGSSNVVVAVLDTGIDYTHPDLTANMGVDADGNFGIDVANNDTDPMDDNEHGTHVSGTIGAVGNNGIGVVGVNWNVKLLACKFFDATGYGTTEGAIACLDYVKTMKDRGINIVATSNSWGGGDFSQALVDAIDAQRQDGILFITAAGNGNAFGIGQNNDTTPFYPCDTFLPNVICVAATTSSDGKASFSNYGRHTVHVGAPGQGILSTVPGGGYASLDGTSMATPHVSGLAALLKAQDPNRDWRAIKNLILTGGDTISSMSNTITGKRINANGSFNCSNTAIQTRLEPITSTISASPGVPVLLASLNIKCANPNGNLSVSVSSGGTITLLDDGSAPDQAAGDGIYSGQWIPSAPGTYTLTFPGNDKITVNVANPTISVTPSSLDFGGVGVGGSIDKTITVKNTGGGILAGSATANAPYAIASGGTYNLSGGQSQTVTVRFAPTSAGTFASNVTFTGGAGASVTVTGFTTSVNSITPNPVDLASPPASFTLTGNGFANLGFGLPAVNFTRNGVKLGQVLATSMTNTTLVVPFPGTQGIFNNTLPGLSAGPVTVEVYNHTSSSDQSWGLVGSTSLTVNDTRTPPGVNSITPNPIDLASPPASFTITGSGFANLGYGLPVVNFARNGVNLGQVRATSMNNTTLIVPFPTTQGVFGTVPGLSAGPVSVECLQSDWFLLQ